MPDAKRSVHKTIQKSLLTTIDSWRLVGLGNYLVIGMERATFQRVFVDFRHNGVIARIPAIVPRLVVCPGDGYVRG